MNNDNRNHSRKPNPIHHEHQKDREHIHTDVKQLMSPVQDPVTAPDGFNYESAQIQPVAGEAEGACRNYLGDFLCMIERFAWESLGPSSYRLLSASYFYL